MINVCEYPTGKYPIGKIYGHQNFAETACPGVKLPFQEIKDSAAIGGSSI